MVQQRQSKTVVYENNLNQDFFFGTVDIKNEKAESPNSALSIKEHADIEHGNCHDDNYSLPYAPDLHKHKELYVSERFIKFIPSQTSDWLRSTYPNAFLILSVIAERARRTNDMPDGLLIGDAIISYEKLGESCGLSKKQVRLAIEKLVEHQILEIIWNGRGAKPLKKRALKRALKGMLVNLCDSSIWDINPEREGTVEGTQRALKGHSKGTKQEGRRRNKNEEDIYSQSSYSKDIPPPNPDSGKKRRKEDSFFSKKREYANGVFLSEDEYELIKQKFFSFSIEKVLQRYSDWKHGVGEFSNGKGCKTRISRDFDALQNWDHSPEKEDIIPHNIQIAKEIQSKYLFMNHTYSIELRKEDVTFETKGAIGEAYKFMEFRFEDKYMGEKLEKVAYAFSQKYLEAEKYRKQMESTWKK